ncbi:HlyD family secretion protein [Leptolyngbya sp. DQ-M1]|uniref:HlyD family secretion protein n=1 Tax=Leptolyngbya sp. DQ-M1 TaxID=2933920 RepID=UPI0032988932
MLVRSDSDSLRPVQSDEFLPSIGLLTRLSGLFLIGAVGVTFALASVTKYNITVKAPAIVRPSGELRIVQAAMEGSIKEIAVKENQVVKQGDVIAYLDNSRLQTQKSQLQGNIQQNQQQLAQIAAQLEAINNQQSAESDLLNRAVVSAQADLSLNQREYAERRVTIETGVQEAEAALELAREETSRYQQLGSTGAISQLQIKEKEQAFKAAQARLKRAKAALNPSMATVTIAAERIDQERARGLATLASLDKERKTLLQRQVEMQNQIDRDRTELQQTEVELKKAAILAPISGTILKLNLRNPSQVVSSGEVIAQIAPSHASMIMKARVAAQDISKIQLCQEERAADCKTGRVHLRFSAYPYPDYGILKGAVRAIAPDATLSQPSSANGNPSTPIYNLASSAGGTGAFYEVAIQVDQPYFVKDGHQSLIQPGMEATADIISREDTALKFLLRKARLSTSL